MSKSGIIPPKPTENGHPFPDVLNDEWEIEAFIETFAPYSVDEEFVIEQFRGEHAVLQLVPIDQLREGHGDHHVETPANEHQYQTLPLETLPPLLVRNGEVLDGNHRLRAMKKRGLESMWCYVIKSTD
jgi:hypothetical protein